MVTPGGAASNGRTHGKCGNCNRRFNLSGPHIAYGGVLWCGKTCLAEYAYEHDMDPEQVGERLEERP